MSNQLREALVIARAGLVWYQENYPETFSECDNEALEQIDAALASQAQQDKEANSNRLTDAQIEDIGKEILNHGTHEWEGLQPWVYVFARRIASVSEQLLGNLEEFKLSEAQQDHIPDGGKMVQSQEQQTESKPVAWGYAWQCKSVGDWRIEKLGEGCIPPKDTLALYALPPASQVQQESKELGHSYGIVDPDYARIYTQSRIIAWQYGYSCLMHGSFTRDLDLLLVPWEESARDNHDQLLKLIADACGLQFKDGEKEIYKAKVDWTTKPHGRKSCSLFFKEARDRRWIDIAVLPVIPPAPEGE